MIQESSRQIRNAHSCRSVILEGVESDESRDSLCSTVHGAGRRLPEVPAHHRASIRALHTLTPLGVAMAGEDVKDPYQD
jgi:hypothetical protein